MNIYCFDLSLPVDIGEAMPLLSKQRREYCSKMKNPAVKRQSVFSYILLCRALYREFGIAEAPDFVFGEHGKPLLRDYPDIYFSMSHCKAAVVCAVSREPVGADIQDVRKTGLSAAGKFCTESELARLSELSEADAPAYLCRLWSVKESYGKMTGNGFSEGFRGIDAGELIRDNIAAVTEFRGNIVSACVKGGIDTLNVRELTENDILRLN